MKSASALSTWRVYLQWIGSHFTARAAPREKIVAAMQAIAAHEHALTRLMLEGQTGLSGLLMLDGVTVYGETAHLDSRQAIIAFNLAGVPTAEIMDYLEAYGVRVHNRTNNTYSRHTLAALGINECIRVSLGHYNTPAEVLTFLRLLCDYRR